MSFHNTIVINLLLLSLSWFGSVGVMALNSLGWSSISLLPPAVRIQMGNMESLHRDCERASSNTELQWHETITEGYEIAQTLFRAIAVVSSSSSYDKCQKLWFPAVVDDATIARIQKLSQVVCANSNILGGVMTKVITWPYCPATHIDLSWDYYCDEYSPATPCYCNEEMITSAVKETEVWVDGTLGRLRLCPFTTSMKRAAVGLESVGVSEGTVGIRHSSSLSHHNSTAAAAMLACAFWNGVSELMQTPESQLSTLLILGLPSYDDSFVAFATVCDLLLEPSVQAIGADAIIGKAWFHPMYNASLIGHSQIMPGHALPATMVQKFLHSFYEKSNSNTTDTGTTTDVVATANDKVRHTPHATVNILRRSQLNAAKNLERALPVKRPNAIYAKNILRILSSYQKDS